LNAVAITDIAHASVVVAQARTLSTPPHALNRVETMPAPLVHSAAVIQVRTKNS